VLPSSPRDKIILFTVFCFAEQQKRKRCSAAELISAAAICNIALKKFVHFLGIPCVLESEVKQLATI
jgi:hypothetical protein